MALPSFCAGPDGFFRFGPELADWVAMLVALEVERRTRIQVNLQDREVWASLFNDVVHPAYKQPHTAEQMGKLEEQIRQFRDKTASNYLQVRKLRQLRNLPKQGPFA